MPAQNHTRNVNEALLQSQRQGRLQLRSVLLLERKSKERFDANTFEGEAVPSLSCRVVPGVSFAHRIV